MVNNTATNILMGAAVSVILALSTWMIKTTENHTEMLAAVSVKIDDLTSLVANHNTATDVAIGKALDDERSNAVMLAIHEKEINDMKQAAAIGRPTQRQATITENPITSIGSAISHILSPPHSGRRMMRSRGRGR